MECFAKDPETLEKLRFTLSEQSAERQGIGPRLDFALRCREEKRLLKAKDWLKLALDARVYAGRAFLRPADVYHVTRRSELVRHTHATADERFGIGGP